MITKQLAEEIVHQTMVRLNKNINIMDTNGMILFSGESERINRIHEGAAHVAQTGQPLWITEENLEQWHGTKIGANLPIRFKNDLVGVVGITGKANELKDVATLVQLTTEMMVHQSLITSEAEWKRKIKELVFEELTSDKTFSPLVVERLSLLEFKMEGPYLIVFIQTKNLPPSPQRMIEQLEEIFERNTALIGYSKFNELFLFLSDVNPTVLEMKLKKILHLFQNDETVKIGIGLIAEELMGIPDSYRSAKQAIRYGHDAQEIVYYTDIELRSLLQETSIESRSRFSSRILSGLNEQMIKTLQCYYDNKQSVLLTADRLRTHRHTVTNRLRKIKEMAGLDPTNFHDAVLFYIALLFIKTTPPTT